MKWIGFIIFIVAIIAIAANADDYYLCFTTMNDRLNFATIPGPGTYDGFDVVHSFAIPSVSNALTYDGSYWWIHFNGEIYCFDQYGDYVRSFPRPYYGHPAHALAWDGQYLWVEGGWNLYQMDIYGDLGPCGVIDIDDYLTFCSTVKDNRLVIGNDTGDGVDICHLEVYDFNGNHLFTGYEYGYGIYGHTEGFGSLAYHDGIIWVKYYYHDGYGTNIQETYGLEYREGQNFLRITTIENTPGTGGFTVCDADFINVAESSLGKIKAYFAEMEK